jgi:hypothetical protein
MPVTAREDNLNLLHQLRKWRMLDRIPFPNDYGCLSGTTDIIDFIETLKETESSLKTVRQQIEAASLQVRHGAQAVREEVLGAVTRRLMSADPVERYQNFCSWMHDAARDFPRNTYESRTKREKAVGGLSRLYVRFQAEDFEKDFDEWQQQVTQREASDPATELARLRQEEAELTVRLDQHWRGAEALFKDGKYPSMWRDSKIDTSLPGERQHAQRRQIAKQIVGNFEADWRYRVAFFDCPVTVDGVAIETMSEPRRSGWLDAYNRWGLDKVKKRLRRCRPNISAAAGLPSPQHFVLH